jgi:hypothetical protein
MGTNYYWRAPNVEHVNEDDDGSGLHICKISAGSVGMRGHLGSEATPPILSWDDWRKFLRAGLADAGAVWSEYGYAVPVEDFIAEVDAKPMRERRAQIEWLRHDLHSPYRGQFREEIKPYGSWSDREGYSFYAGYFC